MSTEKHTGLAGITSILFDLDGTLRHVQPNSQAAALTYLQELGHPIEEEARRTAIRWTHAYWADAERVRRDRNAHGPEGFWRRYLTTFLQKLAVADATVTQGVIARFLKDFTPVGGIVPGVKQMLWELRERRYQVGLVSNRSEPLTGVAIELGIIEHLNFTLAAGQVGKWKPDPGLLLAALAVCGAAPEEAIYVGDNYYADVIAAQRAGIRAVLVDTHSVYGQMAGHCIVVPSLEAFVSLLPDHPSTPLTKENPHGEDSGAH